MRYLVFLIAILVGACSPKFQVQTTTPNPGSFGDYHSFKFYNPANIPASNFSFEEEDQKLIFDAISDEMKMRGYKSIQQADLMIKVQGGTKSAVEIQNNNWSDYGPNYYNSYGYGRYNDYYNRPRDQSKKETILIVDVIDTKSDKVVWQGVATGVLGRQDLLTEEEIKTAIAGIFAQYPQQ